jgi:Zn-dependent protease with chaperone function
MASNAIHPHQPGAGQSHDVATRILNAFQGPIQPVRPTIMYRLGVLAVLFVMVLLPILYLAFIGAAGYLLYWHAVSNTGILEYGRGRGKAAAVGLYVAPLVVGAIMILFMLKPLFARAAREGRRRTLSRDQEPLLFAFIDRVCQAVHAPPPKQIDVDCEVNASASFRRGFLSMIFSRDLVLTIGMPLVAGLSLRQFAGVLAHEFGHFSQGAGMRVTFVIRTISFWFTRVVYERDAWDVWLEETAKSLDLRLSWVLHLARLAVWLSRRVLWVLMAIGNVVAGYMMRQMEFDADRHEARLAGSDVFATTCGRLIELSIAHSGAKEDLAQFYRDKQLVDDLPGLVMHNAGQLKGEHRVRIAQHIHESSTSLFDTHPCDRDRIASASRERALGVFRLEAPASLLFRDCAALNRAVSADLYGELLGDDFKREAVRPLKQLVERQQNEAASRQAMARFFQFHPVAVRPLPLLPTKIAAPKLVSKAITAMALHRAEIASGADLYRSTLTAFDDADTDLFQAHVAQALFEAQVTPNAEQFAIPVASAQRVAETREAASVRQQQLEANLARFEETARARFAAALSLMLAPEVAKRIPKADELRATYAKLSPVLQRLAQVHSHTVHIRNSLATLVALLGRAEGCPNQALMQERIQREALDVRTCLTQIRDQLTPVPFPFDHATVGINSGDYLVESLPEITDYGNLLEAASGALPRYSELTHRVAAELCRVAEAIEESFGFPPLPLPPEPEPDNSGDSEDDD